MYFRFQVTTHSPLLVNSDVNDLRRKLDIEEKSLVNLYLHGFQTQQQFREKVR